MVSACDTLPREQLSLHRFFTFLTFFPQFLIFQQNNSAQTSVLIFFTSRHYNFFEKLKIVEKQQCKQNFSYGKVM